MGQLQMTTTTKTPPIPLMPSRKSYSTTKKIQTVREVERLIEEENEIIKTACRRLGIPEQNYYRWKSAMPALLAETPEAIATALVASYAPQKLLASPSKDLEHLKDELQRAKDQMWSLLMENAKLKDDLERLQMELEKLQQRGTK